jgi:hypothetical protein
MKVQGNQIPPQVSVPERDPGRKSAGAQRAASPEPAARVARGGFLGAFEAAEMSPLRRDVVDEVRASLAAGTFEKSVNLDQVVDALLAEL